jgi:ankyrin repeat protein
VRLLLRKESTQPDVTDGKDWIPLFYVSEKGYLEIVKLLLSQEGVDPQSKLASGNTPLGVPKLAGRHGGGKFAEEAC